MRLGARLRESFFTRPCAQVASELVGCVLLRRLPGGERLVGRLVEVEAYLGDGSDPSSHSHGGPSVRNLAMFGPPGRLYTYRSYGIHTCANVVCEPKGIGAAVLLRSLEPLMGVGEMRRRRGLRAGASERLIARGPGRLAQALGLGLEHDGASLLSGQLGLYEPGAQLPPLELAQGPRVGITRAAALPYRFYARDDPWVSDWRPGRKGRTQRSPARPTGS